MSVVGAVVTCLVVGISDGDTLTARCGEPDAYQQVKVRLAGIDAPEKKQPFGNASRQALADLCFQQQATITPRSIDRYKRTVADVECQGKDVGTVQVQRGMAWVYDKYSRGYEGLHALQATAKASRLGLWMDAAPTAPWDWRKSARFSMKT